METYFKVKGKQFPKFEKKNLQLNIVEKTCQEYSLSTGEKVASVHPPQATVQIRKDVLAVPY